MTVAGRRGPTGSVLVGPMGAGKTTVGGLLAQRWGVAARDTDADVEAAQGRSIADIFVEAGEAHFRGLERDAVAEALATHDGVLALGGGAVLDPATRELLAGHRVVFLRVGLADAVKRVGLGTGRPLLLGNVRGRIKALLDERTPVYESRGRPRGRHRRPRPRGGRRARSGGAGMSGTPATRARCCTSAARRRTTSWSAAAWPRGSRACSAQSVQRVAVVFAEALARAGPAGARRPRRVVRRAGAAGARRRAGQDRDGGRGLLGGARRGRLHPLRRGRHRRRRRDDRPRRLRGRHLAARRAGRARADHAARRWSTPPWAARPASTPARGKNLVGSFHEPAGRAVRPRDAAHAAARRAGRRAGRGGQVRLHRRPRDPRPGRGATPTRPRPPAPPCCASSSSARSGSRSTSSSPTSGRPAAPTATPAARCSTTATPWRTRSSGPSDYAVRHGEAVAIGCVYVAELAAPRRARSPTRSSTRHRAALRAGRAADAPGDGAPFDDLLAAMRVDKKARGSQLRFVVLDDLARPADARRARRGADLRAAYDAIGGEAS